MKRHVACIIACLCGSVISSFADSASTPAPSAGAIVERMVATYASLGSYSDTGEATVDIEEGNESDGQRVLFSTIFVRPQLFRFELELHAERGGEPFTSHYVVWADAHGIRSWNSNAPVVKEHESIEFALSGPTGISLGAAVRIPTLLLPDMLWGARLRHLRRTTLLGEEAVGSSDCYKLAAETKNPVTLWVDKKTFLVRKLREALTLTDGTISRRTLTYSPSPDVEIAEQEFTFVP